MKIMLISTITCLAAIASLTIFSAEQYPQDALQNTWIQQAVTVAHGEQIESQLEQNCGIYKKILMGNTDIVLDKFINCCVKVHGRLAKVRLCTGLQYCDLSYTLEELDILKTLPAFKQWYEEDKKMITRIKNNTVSKPVDTDKYEMIYCCSNPKGLNIPHDIMTHLCKYIFLIKNVPKQYDASCPNRAKLFSPKNSFDGLSPYINAGNQIPLLPPSLVGKKAYHTKQTWFGESKHPNSVRVSDDYAFGDIFCSPIAGACLFEAEYSGNYVITLSGDKDLRASSDYKLDIVIEPKELAVFALPSLTRMYEKHTLKNGFADPDDYHQSVYIDIRVKQHPDQQAQKLLGLS